MSGRCQTGDRARRGDSDLARAVAAWLCRRHTEEPLRGLVARFGLSRADSVPNLTRRVESGTQSSLELAHEWKGSSGGVGGKPKTDSDSFMRRDQFAMATNRLGSRSAGLASEGARKLFKKAMIAWRSTDGRDWYA
jgi:hypothetical protein